MRRLLRTAAPSAALLAGGCAGWQSALDPHGPGAEAIARLIWIFTGVVTAVWILVMIALAVAVLRKRAGPADIADPLAGEPDKDRRGAQVTGLAVALTAVVVLILTGISYSAQKYLSTTAANSLSIRITGHQWWWEIQYDDPQPNLTFTTANEIHIPVGKPVIFTLTSADVIHSFWVPSLMGKMDLVTGRENLLRVVADRPGVYRGQCAEFCGPQHAHMGVLVIAEEPEDYERWRNSQIAAAAQPTDPERQKGLEAFLSQPCVTCHTIRGTDAGGNVAPDLTHIGSRRSIAAGTLPRSRGSLAAWIVDPQGIKPGAHMPMIKLPPDQVNAIAAYLEGLK